MIQKFNFYSEFISSIIILLVIYISVKKIIYTISYETLNFLK
jgi:hypothetical protein